MRHFKRLFYNITAEIFISNEELLVLNICPSENVDLGTKVELGEIIKEITVLVNVAGCFFNFRCCGTVVCSRFCGSFGFTGFGA
jgi:hypothetical protein